jgi:ubiquinone/menaquinone biosynthesis C-methylase UbiE
MEMTCLEEEEAFMAGRVCPPWIGYLLLNPLRNLLENPNKVLGEFVKEGMVVLEPGPGMGFFTLPMARMVGPSGRVVAVEIQPKMLAALERRARRADLLERIELRQAKADELGLTDLAGQVDLAVALHVVHEVPDQGSFFIQVHETLKSDGRLLIVEPKHHVSRERFAETLATAKGNGFTPETMLDRKGRRAAVLGKAQDLSA